jgi:hypothetical protein
MADAVRAAAEQGQPLLDSLRSLASVPGVRVENVGMEEGRNASKSFPVAWPLSRWLLSAIRTVRGLPVAARHAGLASEAISCVRLLTCLL